VRSKAWRSPVAGAGGGELDELGEITPVARGMARWRSTMALRYVDTGQRSGGATPTPGIRARRGAPGSSPGPGTANGSEVAAVGVDEPNGTVIVIEDDAHISDLVAAYLRRDGFRVLQRPDGSPASTRPSPSRPPRDRRCRTPREIDGFEVCRRLRREVPCPSSC